ncbi:glycosyl transferase [Candidatus Magnetomorum sp. HK-1]|nr:glycosyl transferase [Candidatus Magnetomorum sp. HK-1]
MKILIISHILPSSLKTVETLALGDAIRIILAAKIIIKKNIKIDLLISHNIYNLLLSSEIQPFLPTIKIINESNFLPCDFNQYYRIIYADNPCSWPYIKKMYNLPDVELLWECNPQIQIKDLSKNLVSNLLAKNGIVYTPQYRFQLSNTKKKVGLNYIVPDQWKIKTPSKKIWNQLYEKLLYYEYQPSFQQGESNIDLYLKWIKNQDVIVTANSLGLHLSMLFNKGIVLLLGSTWCEESSWLSEEFIFKPIHCELYPCYKHKCPVDKNCFESLTINHIIRSLNLWFH